MDNDKPALDGTMAATHATGEAPAVGLEQKKAPHSAPPLPRRRHPFRAVWNWIKTGTTSTDWLIVILTAVIAGTSYLQWREIRAGSTDTHTLALAADTQARKMTDMSTAADKIREAAQNMVSQDQRIADNAQHALDASNKQSNAALNESIAASRLDQRAWVGVKGIDGTPQLNQPWEIHVIFINTGKTPARKVRMRCTLESEENGTAFTFPKIPLGNEHSLILPNQEPYCAFSAITVPKVTQDTLDVLASKQRIISVYGLLTYEDVFGSPHWLKFCKIMHQDGKAWDDCDRGGNDTGDGKEPN